MLLQAPVLPIAVFCFRMSGQGGTGNLCTGIRILVVGHQPQLAGRGVDAVSLKYILTIV